jgi:hypothetical protein
VQRDTVVLVNMVLLMERRNKSRKYLYIKNTLAVVRQRVLPQRAWTLHALFLLAEVRLQWGHIPCWACELPVNTPVVPDILR